MYLYFMFSAVMEDFWLSPYLIALLKFSLLIPSK